MVKVLCILLCFFIVGCATHTSVCPDFQKPTQEVLDSVKSLNNPEVDNWLIDLYKLNQKLKICKE